MKTNNDLKTVYRKLAERIESDTSGCEITRGESEITHNKRLFWVAYEIRREFNDVFYSYDVEPDSHVKTHLSITDYDVFDEEGQSVTSDFDPSVIEEIMNDYE